MEITFWGHACLTVAGSHGPTVVMDPYRPGAFGGRIQHRALKERCDVVTVSHWHVDHSHITSDLCTAAGDAPAVVDQGAAAAGVAFDVRFTYHDAHHGTRMGMVGMVSFELDGLRVAHLGDIGCALTPEDARALGEIDVLIWPVGGVYTLGPHDAQAVLQILRPRVALPVHYDNARCQLGLATIDELGPALGPRALITRPGHSRWSSADGVPARPRSAGERPHVLVLEPAL